LGEVKWRVSATSFLIIQCPSNYPCSTTYKHEDIVGQNLLAPCHNIFYMSFTAIEETADGFGFGEVRRGDDDDYIC